MPSNHASLLSPMPCSVGQTLPGLRIPGVRRYSPTSPAENPVSAIPASSSGTSGRSSAAPSAISPAESSFRKVGGFSFPRNG
jgi:hypothetical protein